MSDYDTIKALEANFPVPQPEATIVVADIDFDEGTISYEVPTRVERRGDGAGSDGKPIVIQAIGGKLSVVNVYNLTLRFTFAPRQGDVVLTISDVAPVTVEGGQGFVDIAVTPAQTSLDFSLQADGNSVAADLPLLVSRIVVGAGAMTIPVLPLGIVYAPPVDRQRRNVARLASTSIVSVSTQFSLVDKSGKKVPTALPIEFSSWTQLAAEFKIAGDVLKNVKNPFVSGLATALSTLSGLLGSASASGSIETTVTEQNKVTVTDTKIETLATDPNAGGPGAADILFYLLNARVCWFANNGVMKLALIGWDGVANTRIATLKAGRGPVGIGQQALASLVGLDPLALAPDAPLDPARFKHVGKYEVNGYIKETVSYTLTAVDFTQTTNVQVDMLDTTASFLSFVNIGILSSGSYQWSLTQNSSRETTSTKTITREFEFYALPDELYAVDVFVDVIFGSFLFRAARPLELPRTIAVTQQVSFTGTSAYNEGAFVEVQGSTSLLGGPASGGTLTFGPFTLSYPGVPSSMVLDARFVVDGIALPRTRFPQAGNVQAVTLSTLLPDLAPGDHTVAVEVRSVLLGGPPAVMTITGPAPFALG